MIQSELSFECDFECAFIESTFMWIKKRMLLHWVNQQVSSTKTHFYSPAPRCYQVWPDVAIWLYMWPASNIVIKWCKIPNFHFSSILWPAGNRSDQLLPGVAICCHHVVFENSISYSKEMVQNFHLHFSSILWPADTRSDQLLPGVASYCHFSCCQVWPDVARCYQMWPGVTRCDPLWPAVGLLVKKSKITFLPVFSVLKTSF